MPGTARSGSGDAFQGLLVAGHHGGREEGAEQQEERAPADHRAGVDGKGGEGALAVLPLSLAAEHPERAARPIATTPGEEPLAPTLAPSNSTPVRRTRSGGCALPTRGPR